MRPLAVAQVTRRSSKIFGPVLWGLGTRSLILGSMGHTVGYGSALGLADPLGEADCEALGSGLVVQPVATGSSLAFIAAAIVLGVLWWRRGSGGPISWLYAGLLALVGVGSVAYHGPQTAGSELAHDVVIALLVALALLVPLVRRLRRRRMWGPAPHWLYVLVLISAAIGLLAYWLGRTDSPVCDPDSLLQLHALWHVAMACALAGWGAVLWPPSKEQTP